MAKKTYIKPEVNLIALDNSISLVMMSFTVPTDPPPRGGAKGTPDQSKPFASPFGDKPFK